MEDDKILDLFFERQENALKETELKYGRKLFRLAMNVLNNKPDAEECVNDTLLKAWEAIPPNRPDAFGAFLAKIVRNLSINKWKAKGAVRRGGGEADLLLSELEDCLPSTKDTPEEVYESRFVTKAIDGCLNSMDQTARVVFVLRYFHGESILGICERFNMSESKVKSLLFRARKKLKAHLEKEGVTL
ncbi:MAG: RNA polymerase sigma factor [Defluviitaleaceae bacterium]|nr:RNA polymerase sigma factor [Defluviitaleaceae bacterium]